MKKFILIGLVGLVLLITFLGCDILGIGNKFVGSWSSTNVSPQLTMQFTSDNSVTMNIEGETVNGTYTYTDSYVTFNWYTGGGGSFEYYFTGNNQLSIYQGSDGIEWIHLTKTN